MQGTKNIIRNSDKDIKFYLIRCLVIFLFSFFAFSNFSFAKTKPRNYYFSAKGNDINLGTSPSRAWRTMRPVANITIVPADSFLFNGNDTFPGCLTLWNSDSGTAAQPLVFTSYGTGKAHINAGDSFGFFIYNVGGVVFKNLDIYGSGKSDSTLGNGNGLEFFTDNLKGHKYKYIRVEDVDLHNFASTGLTLGSQNTSYSGFEDIRITGSNFYNNRKNGMVIYDIAGQKDTSYSNRNLYIGNCVAYKNGVTGIVVGGVSNGLIEKCRSSYTGSTATNGVSFMVSNSKNVTLQYCISDHMVSIGPDGEGFDLDGGSEYCTIQYCYSFQNYGYGYMFCDYPYSRRTHNNIIRYNISENDARKPADYQSGFAFISWGTGLDSCYMYNNTVYGSDNAGNYTVNGIEGYVLTLEDSTAHYSHCFAFNNNIYLSGINANNFVQFYGGKYPVADSNILFIGNNYYSTNSNSKRWMNNSNVYKTLTAWQNSQKQEIVGTTRYGSNKNPSWLNPGGTGTITDPDSLKYLTAYTYDTASLLPGTGINVDSLLPFKNAPYDFYGDTLYPHHVSTPGADEPQPIHFAPITNFNFKNICFGDTVKFKDSSLHANTYHWDFGDTTASKANDSSANASPAHLYSKPGNYVVTLRESSLYGKSDSISKTITIQKLPSANWTETHSGLQYTFKAADSTLAYYMWNFNDSTSSIDSSIANHKFSHSGKMVVNLSVRDSNQCKANKTDTLLINFSAINSNSIANKFNWSISPNPFSESTTISYELASPSNVNTSLYDIRGIKITMIVNGFQSAGMHIETLNKNVLKLSAGVYFVELNVGKEVDLKKIIVQ